MKKLVALLMAAALMCCLLGCRNGYADDPKSTLPSETNSNTTQNSEPAADLDESAPAESTEAPDPDSSIPEMAPDTTDPEEPADGLVAVMMSPVKEFCYSEEDSERLILAYEGQRASILIPEHPEAAKKIEDTLNNRLQVSYQSVPTWKAAAEQDLANGFLQGYYSVSVSLEPTRVDQKIMSFQGSDSEYFGGAHPSSALSAMTFDTTTGQQLFLTDILAADSALDTVEQMILQELEAQDGEVGYFGGYQETVSDHLRGNADENWYLSDDGLCFFFSPYDIAPYAAGMIQVQLPYEDLVEILKEEVLPVKTETLPQIEFNASKLEDVNAEDYANILQVDVDEIGERVALLTPSILRDVRVVYHTYLAEDYATNSVLIAANRLTAADLIQIQVAFPDVAAPLSLQARGESGSRCSYDIFQSGEDGSIIFY